MGEGRAHAGGGLALRPSRPAAAAARRPWSWPWRGRSGASCGRRSSARGWTSCWSSTRPGPWRRKTSRRTASAAREDRAARPRPAPGREPLRPGRLRGGRLPAGAPHAGRRRDRAVPGDAGAGRGPDAGQLAGRGAGPRAGRLRGQGAPEQGHGPGLGRRGPRGRGRGGRAEARRRRAWSSTPSAWARPPDSRSRTSTARATAGDTRRARTAAVVVSRLPSRDAGGHRPGDGRPVVPAHAGGPEPVRSGLGTRGDGAEDAGPGVLVPQEGALPGAPGDRPPLPRAGLPAPAARVAPAGRRAGAARRPPEPRWSSRDRRGPGRTRPGWPTSCS